MNIAIVLKTFPPDVIGGMETQTHQMATELQNRDHNVTVFTKRFGNHNDTNAPYEVVRVWNWKRNAFISDLSFLFFAILEILQRRTEFDLLQCMMIYPVGFLGYIINKLTGIPYFAWIRGGDYYLMNDVSWKRWMMRRVLEDTLVLAQSAEIYNDVIADFSDIECNIEVVGNAVSVPNDTASGEGILYVGRLAPKKGVEYLIEAVTNVDTHLTIVGDGSQRDRLEELTEELCASVTFVGEVSPEEVDEYYRNAAVFVLPSLEGEGMPNAVLEAMAWGVPVVVTNSGGLPTIVADEKTGYIVPMRDPVAITSKIEILMENPMKRNDIGESAREYVKTDHSWSWLISELQCIYEQLVEDAR